MKLIKPASIALACAMFALSGCGGVRTKSELHALNAGQHPKTAPEFVIVYQKATDVPGRYEDIGDINSHNYYDLPIERVFKEMRKEASRMGANAVLVETIYEPPRTTGRAVSSMVGIISPAWFMVDRNKSKNQRKVTAKAIYVYPASEQPPAPVQAAAPASEHAATPAPAPKPRQKH